MTVQILQGDCRETLKSLADMSVHCCVTSPPYFGLRDYGHSRQIGLENTPDEYIAQMVEVFREVRRILRDDGTVWLNLGDSYAGSGKGRNADSVHYSATDKQASNRGAIAGKLKKLDVPQGLKPKDLMGIPWRVALALQADGWWLRQDIIWAKPNPMPESVTDRCTRSHEYIFMLSKSARYYYDAAVIMEDCTGNEDRPTFRGGAYVNNSTFNNSEGGKSTVVGNVKRDKQRGHGRRHAGFNDRWDAASRREQCSGKRNKRSVWAVAPRPFKGAHFATFPPALIEPCVLAGSPVGGTVLDPFGGAGTTGLVACRNGRNAILCELSEDYTAMARTRIDAEILS